MKTAIKSKEDNKTPAPNEPMLPQAVNDVVKSHQKVLTHQANLSVELSRLLDANSDCV